MINCPKCGEELEDGAVFCTSCGTKLSTTCPKCGKVLKSGAKFCSGCGANLAELAKPTCPNCGAELEEGAQFCDQCGHKIGGNSSMCCKNDTDDYEDNSYESDDETKKTSNKENIALNMVKIPDKGFSMLETPVTQKLYEDVTGENPSCFDGEDNPVEMVNFFDAVIFCNLLSIKNNKQPCYSVNGETDVEEWPFRIGDSEYFNDSIEIEADFNTDGYRLPTPEEWVIAAEGGQYLKHAGSDKLKNVGWYTSNSQGMTHPVKQKQENGYGLYDMNGNVWEWVWTYGEAYGGSWKYGKDSWGTSTYDNFNPNSCNDDVGFRIVCGYDEALNYAESLYFESDDDNEDTFSYEDYEDNSYSDDSDEEDYDDESTEEKIQKIVDKYIFDINKSSTAYNSSELHDYKYSQVLQNIRSYIAKDASSSEIIGFIDTTVFGKGKAGLVFTTEAIYNKEPGNFWKVTYSQIKKEGSIRIGNTYYNIPALKDCLNEILAII